MHWPEPNDRYHEWSTLFKIAHTRTWALIRNQKHSLNKLSYSNKLFQTMTNIISGYVPAWFLSLEKMCQQKLQRVQWKLHATLEVIGLFNTTLVCFFSEEKNNLNIHLDSWFVFPHLIRILILRLSKTALKGNSQCLPSCQSWIQVNI